jgi:hypothetical protein
VIDSKLWLKSLVALFADFRTEADHEMVDIHNNIDFD